MTPFSLEGTPFAKQRAYYSVLRVRPQEKRIREGQAKSKVLAYEAGADDAEVPPVPIPNTEVKLCRAEDSWLETTRENR